MIRPPPKAHHPARSWTCQPGGSSLTHPIVLELRNDGTYALNRQIVSHSELARYLWRVYSHRDESILFVKAGSDRRYWEVIEAFDRARGAGVQVVALAP